MVLELLSRRPGASESAPGHVGSRRAIFHAASGECRRLLRIRRLWLVTALVFGYGAVASVLESRAVALGAGVEPGYTLGIAVGLQVMWLAVLALPLVVGGSLAQDRSSGYVRLQLARGMTLTRIVTARLLAAVGVSAAVVITAAVGICVAATVLAPAAPSPVGNAVPFAPGLLESAPLAWVATVVVVYTLACATALGFSVLIGLMARPIIAQAAPPALMLALGFVMVGPLWSLNPLERASFLQIHGTVWATDPLRMAAYWAVALVAVSGTAIVLAAATKEVT